MLTSNTINGMLDVLNGYLTNITLVEDASETLSLDDNLGVSDSKICGYTNSGNNGIGISWNTASGGSKALDTSADNTPIMFAVPSGKTPTHIVFLNASRTIRGIDKLDTPITHTNDGPFYMYAYNIEMEESV